MKSRTLTISELMKALNKIDDSDETPRGTVVDKDKLSCHILATNLDSDGDVRIIIEDQNSDECLTLEEVIECMEDFGETTDSNTQRLVYVDGSPNLSIELVTLDWEGNALLQTF